MSRKLLFLAGGVVLIAWIIGGIASGLDMKGKEVGFTVEDLTVTFQSPRALEFVNEGSTNLTQWDDKNSRGIETGILYPSLFLKDSGLRFYFHNKDISKYDSLAPTDAGPHKIGWDGQSLDTICANDGYIHMSWGKTSITSCERKASWVEITGSATCADSMDYVDDMKAYERLPQDQRFRILYFKTPSNLFKGMTVVISMCEYGKDFYRDSRVLDRLLSTIKFENIGNLTPNITLLTPNGGETWVQGGDYLVSWKSSGLDSTNLLSIGFRSADGSSVCWYAGDEPIYASQSSWAVTPKDMRCEDTGINLKGGGKYKVQIVVAKYASGKGVADISDDFFTLAK